MQLATMPRVRSIGPVSHQDAKAIARRWIEANASMLRRGAVLQFAHFESDADARFYFDDRNATYHTMICQAIGRAVRRLGMTTDRVTVRATDCDGDPAAFIAQWPRVIHG